MPRTHRDQYNGTKTEIDIKTFYELWPDLKICWFAVTRSSQKIRWPKKNFLMLIPEKHFLVTNILS